jgi:hypothetical protein
MIRAFQIIGACAVMVYCIVRLVHESHLPQSQVVYQPRRSNAHMSYIERWQEEAVYVVFIVMCGSLLVYTLGTRNSSKSHRVGESAIRGGLSKDRND